MAASALFDTSALVALTRSDDRNRQTAFNLLEKYRLSGMVFVNDIVFSEISYSFASAKDAAEVLSQFGVERLESTNECLFYAAKIYHEKYKANGGRKHSVADIFIGAAAEVAQIDLVTFNEKDFLKYFKNLQVVPGA